MEQIHGDVVWNDDVPETSDEDSEENEGRLPVKLPKTRLVDVDQEDREYNDQISSLLLLVLFRTSYPGGFFSNRK